LGDVGEDWRIILKWVFKEMGYGDVYWIHMAQDRVWSSNEPFIELVPLSLCEFSENLENHAK